MWDFLNLFLNLDEENSLHVVVNCGEALLKNNTYWPLVSDFINILSHQSVAKKFLEDHGLLVTWMNFVSFFQGTWLLAFLFSDDKLFFGIHLILTLIFCSTIFEFFV